MSKKVKVTNSVSSPDITERKEIEEALQESEEWYRDLLENANDLIQSVAPDGHFLYVNKMWREILGYSEEEVANLTIWDIIHPDSIPHCREVFQKVTSGETVDNIEAVFVAKDGRLVTVEGSANCRFKGGEPLATRGIFRDITGRKRTEEALQQAEHNLKTYLESAPDGVYLNDLKGKFLYGNKKAEEMTGYEREELIGSSFLKLNLLPAKHLAKAGKLLALNAMGRPTGPDEFELTRKDGSRIWVEINTTPIKQEGKVVVIGFVRDITERKRAREALQESEQKYRALFENLNDAAFLADAETGRILDTNRQGMVLLGRSREEVIGLHQRELHPLEKAKEYRQRFARHVQKGRAADFDGEAIRKDGSIVPVSISAAPVAIGEKQLILGLFRDITERKRMEEEMKVKDNAIASSINAIAIADLKANLTYVNHAFLRMWGYDDEKEILGKNALELWRVAEEAVEVMQVAMDRGGWIGELAAKRKDGSIFDVQLSASVVRNEAGELICRSGSFVDITERKRMEEELEFRRKELEDIMRNVIDGIGVSDMQGKITQANRALAEMYGYHSPDEIIGRPFFDFVAKEDLPRIAERFQEMMVKKEKTAKNIEMIGLKKDGSRFSEMINITNSWDKDGSLIGSFVVVHDITERKRMEQEIQERNEQLDTQNEELQSQAEELMTQQKELMEKTREVEKATRLKSEFLANMSHELRTPLNVIIGFSQLMVDEVTGEINEEQRQSLNDILDGSQRLLDLINEVLDLSKIEAGKMELKPKDVALTEVIKSLTRTMMPILAPRKQSLDIEIEEGLPPVHADKAKLGQVLLNLVDNSSKFTPDGGKLKIEAVKEGDWCRVSVIDNGAGIKQEDQERIFEPFCRLDDPLTKGRSGTGLGLVLVKQIVERYGGRIWVESEHGKGSRFTITVPLATNGQPNPEERDRR